jgi:hypothetical protein
VNIASAGPVKEYVLLNKWCLMTVLLTSVCSHSQTFDEVRSKLCEEKERSIVILHDEVQRTQQLVNELWDSYEAAQREFGHRSKQADAQYKNWQKMTKAYSDWVNSFDTALRDWALVCKD